MSTDSKKYRYIIISGLVGAGAGIAVMLIIRPISDGIVFPVLLGGLTAVVVPLLIVYRKMRDVQ